MKLIQQLSIWFVFVALVLIVAIIPLRLYVGMQAYGETMLIVQYAKSNDGYMPKSRGEYRKWKDAQGSSLIEVIDIDWGAKIEDGGRYISSRNLFLGSTEPLNKELLRKTQYMRESNGNRAQKSSNQ